MNVFLILASILNAIAAALHIGCIYFGAPWYRFFGAGEQMASLAERGSYVPTLITSGIVVVLVIFSAYGYFAAGSRLTLPFTRYVLITITVIYFIRGATGLFFILNPLGRPPEFWLWSSLICLAFGIVHFIGVKQLYCV